MKKKKMINLCPDTNIVGTAVFNKIRGKKPENANLKFIIATTFFFFYLHFSFVMVLFPRKLSSVCSRYSTWRGHFV